MAATTTQSAAFSSLLNRPWTNPIFNGDTYGVDEPEPLPAGGRHSDAYPFYVYTDGILASTAGLSSVITAYNAAVGGAYPEPGPPDPPTLSTSIPSPDKLGINKAVADAHVKLKEWADEYVNTYYNNEQPVALVAISTATSMEKMLKEFGNTIQEVTRPHPDQTNHPGETVTIIPEISKLPWSKTWDEDMVGTLIGSLSRPLEYDETTEEMLVTSKLSFSDALLAYQQLNTHATPEWEAYKAAIRSIPTTAASAITLINSATIATPAEAEALKADIEDSFDVLFNDTTGTIKVAVDNLIAASAALVSHPDVMRDPINTLTQHCNRLTAQVARERLWWGDLHPTGGGFSNFRVTSIIGTAAGYALNLKIYNSPVTQPNLRAAWSRIADTNIRNGINE